MTSSPEAGVRLLKMKKPVNAVLLPILIASLLPVLGQQPQSGTKEPAMKNLRRAPGKLIAEGHNTVRVGPDELLTYRLEEVELPQPMDLEIHGLKERLNTVMRLTITSAKAVDGNRIWINDVVLPAVWEVDVNSLATLIYDRSILTDGAVISVGRGSSTYDLPERLKLPDNFKARLKPEKIEDGNGIVGIRSVLRIYGSERQRFVAIEMKTAKPLPITNIGYSVQIGRRFFDAGGGHTSWSVQLTERQFAELKDGDRVAIGVGAFNIAYLGRLDKRMIDR